MFNTINDRPTVGEWLAYWRERYKIGYIKPSSQKTLDAVLRLYLPSQLAAKPLDEVRAADLELTLLDVPKSRMRLYLYQALNEMFETAERLELIPRNPMLTVPRVKHRSKQGSALTVRERQEFKRKIRKHPLRLLFEFYLWTGCRRSEALAVTWYDIDLVSNDLHIRGTKSTGSNRVMPINEPLRRVLDKLAANGNKRGLLFPDIAADHVTHVFKKLCPRHKLHDLRHTFATVCLESGIALSCVQKWLGHADLTTTSRLYAHVLDDFQRSEALKLRS